MHTLLAHLLGSTDITFVSTPKITGSIPKNSNNKFDGLDGQVGNASFYVEYNGSAPGGVKFEFTADQEITDILSDLNGLTADLTFSEVSGCLVIECNTGGTPEYITLYTDVAANIDAIPLFGMFAYPHFAATSRAGDLVPAPPRPQTQGNPHGTQFLSRKEDRLGSAFNRALASLGLNAEEARRELNSKAPVGLVLEVDETTHAGRLGDNGDGTYNCLYLGEDGDSLDAVLNGRRIYIGGLSATSKLQEIRGNFLIKDRNDHLIKNDSNTGFVWVGAVAANQTTTTAITSPTFNADGEITAGQFADAALPLYSDYGNVLGLDKKVLTDNPTEFTSSTIKFSGTTLTTDVEVGFKVVLSNCDPVPYSNDGNFVITKIISDEEIEVAPLDANAAKILNTAAVVGGGSPTAAEIYTGGRFIHNALLFFEQPLVFPQDGKVYVSIYVEATLGELLSGIANADHGRTLLANPEISLQTAVEGVNAALQGGDYALVSKGIRIDSDITGADPTPEGASDGPHTGSISSWTLTSATGEYFRESDVGKLFKVDGQWARGVALIGYRKMVLKPFRVGQASASGAVSYTMYTETETIRFPAALSVFKDKDKRSGGFAFIEEQENTTGIQSNNGFSHLVKVQKAADGTDVSTVTGTLINADDQVTLTFDPKLTGVLRPYRDTTNGNLMGIPTVVVIYEGPEAGFYLLDKFDGNSIRLRHLQGGTVTFASGYASPIGFFTQAMSTKVVYYQHSNIRVYEASLAAHGTHSQLNDRMAVGLLIDWDGEGRGIHAVINGDDRRGADPSVNPDTASTGYFMEAELGSPADGIHLILTGDNASNFKEFSGNEGIKITSSANYRNLENNADYRTANATPPKSSVKLENSGGDSSIIIFRGTPTSSEWDSPLFDFRSFSGRKGAGDVGSFQGGIFCRELANIYMINAQSSVAAPRIHSVWSVSDTYLGLPNKVYISEKGEQVTHLATDYTVFPFPHGRIIDFPPENIASTIHASLPGLKISLDFSGTKVEGIILGATYGVGDNILIATDITDAAVSGHPAEADQVDIYAKRFRAHFDLDGYMRILGPVDASHDRNPIVTAGDSSENFVGSDELTALKVSKGVANPTYGDSGSVSLPATEFSYPAAVEDLASYSVPGGTVSDTYSLGANEPRASFPNTSIFGRNYFLNYTDTGSFALSDEWMLLHETKNSTNGIEAFYAVGPVATGGGGTQYNFGGGILLGRAGLRGFIDDLRDHDNGYGTSPAEPAADVGIDTVQLIKKIKANVFQDTDNVFKVRMHYVANHTTTITAKLAFVDNAGAFVVVDTVDLNFNVLNFYLNDTTFVIGYTKAESEAALQELMGIGTNEGFEIHDSREVGLCLILEMDLDTDSTSHQFFLKDLHITDYRTCIFLPQGVVAGGIMSARDFMYSTPKKVALTVSHLKAEFLNRSGFSIGGSGGAGTPKVMGNQFHTYEGTGPGIVKRLYNLDEWAMSPEIPQSFFTKDESSACININSPAFDPMFFALQSERQGAGENRDDILAFPGTTGFLIPIDEELSTGDVFDSIEVFTSHLPSMAKSANGDSAELRWGVFYARAPFAETTTADAAGVGGYLSNLYTESASNWKTYNILIQGYIVKLVRHSTGDAKIRKTYNEYTEPFLANHGYFEVLKEIPFPLGVIDVDESLANQFDTDSDKVLRETFTRNILNMDSESLSKRMVDKRQYSYFITVEFWCGPRQWTTNVAGYDDYTIAYAEMIKPNDDIGAAAMDNFFSNWNMQPLSTNWAKNGLWNIPRPTMPKAKFRGAIVNVVKHKVGG